MKIKTLEETLEPSIIPELNEKIIAFMEPFGGKFRDNLTEHEWNVLFLAPGFDSLFGKQKSSANPSPVGINVSLMEVVTTKPRNELHWRHLIHEFGHLLASGVHPSAADDENFIAWEKRVAEIIGAPMDIWHQRADLIATAYMGYYMDDEMPSKKKLDEYYERQLAWAIQCGMIDENGQPRCIRRPGIYYTEVSKLKSLQHRMKPPNKNRRHNKSTFKNA